MMNPFADGATLDMVDIGCSGSLDPRWSPLSPLLSYTGFDPNAEECERLSRRPHPFRAARYLPYAVAGEPGTRTLYKTESMSCYSLLRPNHQWLGRFSFADLFRETGTESVACVTLDDLVRKEGLKADIVKLDTQGLELPILQAGDLLLRDAFCVETETGFVENYAGETTYARIDEFMRSKGFLMFDMNIHRVGRKNALSGTGKAQPLWCQALWLYDFPGAGRAPSAGRAHKALLICKALGFHDFGLELAAFFRDRGLIDPALVAVMGNPGNPLGPLPGGDPRQRKTPASRTGRLLRHLPEGVNRRLLYGLKEILD